MLNPEAGLARAALLPWAVAMVFPDPGATPRRGRIAPSFPLRQDPPGSRIARAGRR